MMLTGRIGSDAQKQVNSKTGHEFISFSVACNEFTNGKDSSGKILTQWFRVTANNNSAISLYKYLTKGKLIMIVGDYRDSLYQNKNNGGWEINREIIADSISFIGDSNNTNGQNESATKQPSTSTKQKQDVKETTSMPQVTGFSPVSPFATEAPETVANISNVDEDDDDLPF